MRFGSLFSGIGGLDLGLERAGHECAWQVEIDPYCLAVLQKHWPDVPKYPDVRMVGGELERVDLVCGGFPCQPVSVAGRRRGAADERWLWPEFARILRVLRPRYALLENVPGLLAGGGMAEVLGDLAALGFDAEWDCIPAAAVGAPHLRWRVFVVAYANGARQLQPGGSLAEIGRRTGDGGRSGDAAHTQRNQLRNEPGRSGRPGREGATVAGHGSAGSLADAEREGLEERTGIGGNARPQLQAAERDGRALADAALDGRYPWRSGDVAQESRGRQSDRGAVGSDVADADRAERRTHTEAGHEPDRLDARRVQAAALLGSEAIPTFDWWAVEPDVGRVAHGVPSRVDRLRALGNAVVPQVAEVIGRRLE